MGFLKFLTRMLITYLFVIAMFILGLVIITGEVQQIIDWPLADKVSCFVTLILPYLLYQIYTYTKFYRFPQNSFLTSKELYDEVKKDYLQPFNGMNDLRIGSSWLEVRRKGIVTTQKKYIKLDQLAGFCVEIVGSSTAHPTRRNTTYYFIDGKGKVSIMNESERISYENVSKIEKEILARSKAKLVNLKQIKQFSRECKETN
ncbi:MAG: hypothetical protein R3Y57_06695 [Erysipelotrichaceae bacterium]